MNELFDMAGMKLPEYLGTEKSDAAEIPAASDAPKTPEASKISDTPSANKPQA